MALPLKSTWTATARLRDAPLSRFNPVHQKAAPVIWRLARHLEAITHMHGCSPGRGWDPSSAEHGTGRTLDWIIADRVGRKVTAAQKLIGDLVVAWLIKYSDALRIRHIIWHGRIWKRRYRNTPSAWTTHRGNSVSARHEDHIHVYLDDAGGWVPDAPLTVSSGNTIPKGDTKMSEEMVRKVVKEEIANALATEYVASGKKQSLLLHILQDTVLGQARSAALGDLRTQLNAVASQLGVKIEQSKAAVLSGINKELDESIHDAMAEHFPSMERAEADEIASTIFELLVTQLNKK